MARTIYTARDIEDLAQRGVKELDVDDGVYLTDLARERMEQLGVKSIKRDTPRGPASPPSGGQSGSGVAGAGPLTESERQQVFDQVRMGVIARLGPGVDTKMVDTIVRRVVNQL